MRAKGALRFCREAAVVYASVKTYQHCFQKHVNPICQLEPRSSEQVSIVLGVLRLQPRLIILLPYPVWLQSKAPTSNLKFTTNRFTCSKD